MSILLKVHEQIAHAYDDVDRDEYDPDPLEEALKRLTPEEREQWYIEAEYLDNIIPILGDSPDYMEKARPLLIEKFGE